MTPLEQLKLRDEQIAACWRKPSDPPEPLAGGKHYPIAVIAVIDDPYFSDQPFIDIVSYWPALKKWTCTHCVRTDEAEDFPVIIRAYQPLFNV